MRAVRRCCHAPNRVQAQAILVDDWRLERLIDRLPNRVRSIVRFLRRPSVRWLRFPTGLLLAFGGIRVPADLWILDASYRLGAPR